MSSAKTVSLYWSCKEMMADLWMIKKILNLVWIVLCPNVTVFCIKTHQCLLISWINEGLSDVKYIYMNRLIHLLLVFWNLFSLKKVSVCVHGLFTQVFLFMYFYPVSERWTATDLDDQPPPPTHTHQLSIYKQG